METDHEQAEAEAKGEHWPPGQRWRLVDSFEQEGIRYVVACEDEADSEILRALTGREREVVTQAAHGSSNKEIAQTLGISDATVRVLMARAANRLGVRKRKELLALPALQELAQKSQRA